MCCFNGSLRQKYAESNILWRISNKGFYLIDGVKLIVTFRVLLKMGCHQKASTLRTTGRIETVIVSTTRKLPPPTMDYTQDAKFIITVQC